MPQPECRQWLPPIDTPLCDLHGCYDDLFATYGFANRLAIELQKNDADPILADALTTAIFIRYSRSFTTGSRRRLQVEEFSDLTFSELSLHKRLQETRDWHMAHPVNLQESHAIYVVFDTGEPTSCEGVSIESRSCRDLTLVVDEAEAVAALCQRWIDWLHPQIELEYQRLRSIAQRLTRAQLLALPTREIEPNQNLQARRRQRGSNRRGNDAETFNDSGH